MYQKILVPLDGSELAEAALPYAEELAGRLGSQVTLVNVHEVSVHPSETIAREYLQKMVGEATRGADACSAKLGTGDIVRVNSEVILGKPADSILEYAEKGNFDLIGLATHGRSGISRWAMGSVADRIIRATTRPVFLTRAKDTTPEIREKGIIRKILVPLDGSKTSEIIIPYIEELAAGLKAEVVLLEALARGIQTISDYVPLTEEELASDNEEAVNYLARISEQFKNKGIPVSSEIRLIIQEGRAADEIIQFTGQMQADLVAMSTHGRSGFKRLMFGSAAERILLEGNTPLFLVKPPPSP